ncbi:MAG: BACON domain-containing protein [Prevotella sp.]|nr:BACON domain-containing protein [Prevotella sp.]
MKIKNIIPAFIAAIALLVVGCTDDDNITLLDNVQVSSSYISLPLDGGSSSFTVNAKGDWKLEKVMTKKDSVKWLTLSDTIGTAGQTEVTLTAPSTLDGRSAELLLTCNGQTQHINVIQGVATISSATCAEVIAGPDSKSYKVTGTVSAIANTTYGNWYLTDNTGTIYIYGTLDAKGAEKNFSSLGLEVGDEVTVSGPKTTYGSVVELVNVTVVEINKSLIKVDSVENEKLPVEGGEFTAYLTCKGEGVSVDIPEDASSWLSISSIQSAGTNAVVKFKAAANDGGDRSTTLTFHTTDGSKDYTSQTTLTQAGAIVDASVADFIAAAVSTTSYRLTGIISKVVDAAKGNVYIKDYSGEVYAYKLADVSAKGLKEGDIVTVVGQRGDYKGTSQLTSGTIEAVNPVTTATIAEVLAKADDTSKFFMVTGTITNIANTSYGNLTLKDATGEIYVYGTYPGYGATGDARKGVVDAMGLKVGDELTVIAAKSSYKGTAQLVNGFYFSHVSAQ